MSNKCPQCSADNRPENLFCTQCGTRLPADKTAVPRLLLLSEEGKDRISYPLKDDKITIGRDIQNQIVIDDTQISNQHATLLRDGESVYISDLNSRNGVYLNGQRVRGKTRLTDGALIKLGTSILRFEKS